MHIRLRIQRLYISRRTCIVVARRCQNKQSPLFLEFSYFVSGTASWQNVHSTDLGKGGHELSEHQRRTHFVCVVIGFVLIVSLRCRIDLLCAKARRANAIWQTANLSETALLSCLAAIVSPVICGLVAHEAVPLIIVAPRGLHQWSLTIADSVDGRRRHSNSFYIQSENCRNSS